MTKYCKKCWKAFADRFCYCPLCGSKLELYDGEWRDDTNITHKDIMKKIEQYEKSSQLFAVQLFCFSVSIAFLSIFISNNDLLYLGSMFLVYAFGWIFVYLNYRLLKKK